MRWTALAAMVLAELALGAASGARAADMPVVSVQQEKHGLLVKLTPGTLRLEAWSNRIIHVVYWPGDPAAEASSLAVIGEPVNTAWTYRHTDSAEILATDAMEARVNSKTGAVGFYVPGGRAVLEESANRIVEAKGRVTQDFRLAGGEGIYGLGQHQTGVWNYRWNTVHLQQANMDIAVPVVMSSRGYGVLWDNPSITDVDAGIASHNDTLHIVSEAGGRVDYYFLFGGPGGIEGAIADYRTLTGAAPMLGEWAWGFWQCKERYKSQQELLDTVDGYRKRQIPIDGIIQDWQYWKLNGWGSHEFDPARYPDPKGAIEQLHDRNVHVLISVWPKFDEGTANLAELEKVGGAYNPAIPYLYPRGIGKWYDAFSAAARKVYWEEISRELLSLGIDGWWLDASEPELSGKWGEFRSFTTAAGPGAEVFNAYPLMHTSGVYAGQRADAPGKRVLILTRSAYAGQQRNSAISWSGDVRGDWETFRRQIPAGLNFSISGIPYWNTDIGGFLSGRPEDPNYRELFTRWFQFGAFCPMFRVHGTNAAKEMWRFDVSTQKILIEYDRLRYRLLPYIYSVAWQVTSAGSTMMRPLVMDFGRDPLALNVGDEYLFGPAILVSPVTQARATARNVYLPAGTDWVDFWTGEKAAGGTNVSAAAPIDRLPLFVRAGSIVPMGPVVQYAREHPDAPIELRVYPGGDGSFTLYEDEGDTYHYEQGAYSTIPLTWNEAERVLTIGKRSGSFPGMFPKREFHVSWVSPGHAAGEGEESDQVIRYDGEPVSVKEPG